MAEQNLQIQNFPKVKVKIAIRFRVCEIWVFTSKGEKEFCSYFGIEEI